MENLVYETKNGWESLTDSQKKEVFYFSKGYAKYLDNGKTERLACREAVRLAKENGFVDLEEKETLKSGDRVYMVNRDKSVYFAVIGKEDIEKGINFVISHIDSPRIDLKQNPLYEDGELALLKTHYYGGIKKYQWTATPLSLIGVVALENGETVNISIGENDNEPIFYISDLLIHLATKQMQKKLHEGIEGEALNIIIGSTPDEKSEKDKFRTTVLKLLNEKYGIKEEDFLSAELEAVPNFKARDIGLDRALIGAYGHDDRVCAYTSLMALLEEKEPQKTAVCMFSDKEEIGSMGNTGMRSAFFEYATALLIEKTKGTYNELSLKRTFRNSDCLSSDVNAAFDPTYPEVNDRKNCAYLSRGVVITKYTGSRGKSGTSDASAEFVAKIRRIFNEGNVVWQTAELGKVDEGGGGTIAQYVANLDINVIDCGVPLLSMHAPVEVASKLDIYMAYKGYKAFYRNY